MEPKSEILKKGKRGLLQIVFSRTMVILLALLLQVGFLLLQLYVIAEHVAVLTGSIYTFTAFMLLFVLNTDSNPSIKLSWCIAIAVLPILGTVLYLFFRFDLGHRMENRLGQISIEESARFVPEPQADIWQRLEADDPAFCQIARYLKNCGNFSVYQNTAVTYFPVGEAMLEAMLQELEKAEKFIFLEYFIVAPGHMWDRILDVLTRKAAQGVEVRVMYDGTCSVALLPYSYPKDLEKFGIQSKIFSPFRPFISTHYNHRDHRKILVIDGHTAFTGGVNLSDEYINRTHPYGHWKDTAVMLKGEGARGFTLLFLQMWNVTQRQRVFQPYLEIPVKAAKAPGYVIPFGDIPTGKENTGKMVYLNILNQAKRYVYIMTPYLILDGEMLTALKFAAKRGVDVRLILPHIPDKKYVFLLARSHYRQLLESGVKIYEYTPGFVHAKMFLADDDTAVVGTINLDYRSLYLHYECAAVLHRVHAIEDIRKDFENTFAVSQQITAEDIRKIGLFSRAVGAVLKVIAPLV